MTAKQGDLLTVPLYLKNQTSGIPGYNILDLVAPTSKVNKTIQISPGKAGDYLIGKWISPTYSMVNKMAVQKSYNFLFCMYGNKSTVTTNNASFFGELGYYRSTASTFETTFFNTSLSDFLPNATLSGLQWQTVLSTNFTLMSGDRIYWKLYLRAQGSGSFYFGYDAGLVPSFLVDPNVTRFFRNDWKTNQTNPTNYAVNTGAYFSGATSDVATSNNVYMVFNGSWASAKSTCQVDFNGTVGSDFHLGYLVITVESKLNTSGAFYFQAYNYTAGGWDSGAGTMFSSGALSTSDVIYGQASTFDGNKYTNTTGRGWRVRLTWNSTVSNITVSVDHVAFYSKFYYLGTSQTTTVYGFDQNVDGSTVGVRIRKINQTYSGASLQSENAYDLTGGAWVAQVSTTGATEQLNGSYSMTHQTLENYTTIWVYITLDLTQYLTTGDPISTTLGTASIWQTEPLNDTEQLDASTWTVCYYFRYYGRPVYQELFQFGDTVKNSRIVGWSTSSTAISKLWYLIATWEVDLLTRSWTSVATWKEDLLSRIWTSVSTWGVDLIARTWASVSSWTFDLFTISWHDVTTWTLDLLTRQWKDAGTWWILLIGRQWTDVSAWWIELGNLNWWIVTSWTTYFHLRSQDMAGALIGGLILVLGLIVFLIVLRRRK